MYRNESVVPKLDDQYFNPPNVNFTDLFNAMIHPLTRMVIYGAIWYQGRKMRSKLSFRDFFRSGESNCAHNQDKYSCAFAKMIEYWRQIWNQRTNGNTDLQFPFGFVQVRLMIIILFIYCLYIVMCYRKFWYRDWKIS